MFVLLVSCLRIWLELLYENGLSFPSDLLPAQLPFVDNSRKFRNFKFREESLDKNKQKQSKICIGTYCLLFSLICYFDGLFLILCRWSCRCLIDSKWLVTLIKATRNQNINVLYNSVIGTYLLICLMFLRVYLFLLCR